MIDVTERWRTERVMAALYDAGVKHDRVAEDNWGRSNPFEHLADTLMGLPKLFALRRSQAGLVVSRFHDYSLGFADPCACTSAAQRVISHVHTTRRTSPFVAPKARRVVIGPL
jgi:hypothetical protein